jgi:hypothetical protein
MEETTMLDNRRSIVRKAVVLLASAAVVGGGIFVGAGPAAAAVDTTKFTVTKLSTSTGSDGGGTAVLITGKGFTRTGVLAANVSFNRTPAASIAVISDSQMTATTAAGTAGTGVVLVGDGTSTSDTVAKAANKWTYVTPLVLSTLATGTKLNSLGGTSLPIVTSGSFGSDKTAFTALKITATVDSVSAKVSYVDSTHATVAVPAGSVDTTAATPAIVCLLSNGVKDTTVANTSCDVANASYAAVISKLSVTSSGLAGSPLVFTALTITGKGFKNNTGVLIGANAATCTSATATADTKLVCNIPAATVTTGGSVVQVTVTPVTSTNSFGTTAASAFTYTDV